MRFTDALFFLFPFNLILILKEMGGGYCVGLRELQTGGVVLFYHISDYYSFSRLLAALSCLVLSCLFNHPTTTATTNVSTWSRRWTQCPRTVLYVLLLLQSLINVLQKIKVISLRHANERASLVLFCLRNTQNWRQFFSLSISCVDNLVLLLATLSDLREFAVN